VIAPLAAKASLMSGQDLLSACGGDGNGRTVCDGYLMGLTDIVLHRESRGHGGRICLPASVTVDQVRDAVLAVGHRPRLMRAPSGVAVVAAAMRVTWPCAGNPGGAADGEQSGFMTDPRGDAPNAAPPPR
jgi:hypothetical protein